MQMNPVIENTFHQAREAVLENYQRQLMTLEDIGNQINSLTELLKEGKIPEDEYDARLASLTFQEDNLKRAIQKSRENLQYLKSFKEKYL